MKRNILFALGILVSLGIILAVASIYNKPHRNISGEQANYEVTLDQFYAEFVENQNAAYQKYNQQVIKLAGTVQQINGDNGPVNLLVSGSNGTASCEMAVEFQVDETALKAGDPVVVKGLFIGYDDLLGELQLKKCSVVEN